MANNTYQFDIAGNAEQNDVYLRRRNLETVGCLHPIESLKLTKRLNDYDEISFSIPKVYNGKVNPYWDSIVDLSVVFVQQHGNYEITVSTNTDGVVEKKNISGKSLEVELDHVKLFDFQINTDDIEDEDYSPIKFYDPIDVEHSLFHLALKKLPSWSILHVDAELWSKQRSFDVNDISIYGFLTGEVAKELECIFTFDTFNRTISCFKLENYGHDTNVYIDCENYAKEITLEAPADQIFNWFKVYGGDDVIDIREVNPNGTDYITCLGDNDKKDMSPELVESLDSYDILYDSRQDEFIDIMREWQEQVDVIWDLYNKYPESPPVTGDYGEYGLNYLTSMADDLQSIEDDYLSMGYGNVKDSHYSVYSANHDRLLDVKAELSIRESEIETQQLIAEQIRERIKEIQAILNLEDYLGRDLYLELSNYKRESTYTNSNYTVTDYTTDSERIEMELELMNRAMEDLKKACNPQPTLTSTINNLLARPEFQHMALNDFQLGNFIHVGVNEDYVAKIRLISIEYDFDNISDIIVEFSDMTKSGDMMDDFSSIIDQAQSAATSYEIVERQMTNASDHINFVEQMRIDGLNTAHTNIISADNIGVTWDNHGLLLRKRNEEKLDWEDQQLKLIHNSICFTNDYWRSVQAALGYVNVNGHMVYGLIADAFVGKWIFSEYAYIENENGTMTFDMDGLRVYSSDFLSMISLNPGKKDGLFEIWKNHNTPNAERIVWIDDGGNAWFKGNITSSSITTSKFTCTNGKNTVIIDPNDNDSIFTILKGDEKQIYFDIEGNAVFNGHMTIGVIFSQNWLDSEGEEGTYINLTDGTFHFGGEHLVLTEDYLQCNGYGDYEWMGGTFGTDHLYTRIDNGRIMFRHDAGNKYDLFITPTGIATTIDANPESSGVIDFYSKVYGDNLVGMTLQTYGSPIALKSKFGAVLINPYAETAGNDSGLFRFSHSASDGTLAFGYFNNETFTGRSGLKFTGAGSESLVSVISEAGSLGNLRASNMAMESGTIRGVDIATKTDLDSLETEWRASLQDMYDSGYNKGRTDGYNSGYSSGRSAGYSEGYSAGYSAGYAAGSSGN